MAVCKHLLVLCFGTFAICNIVLAQDKNLIPADVAPVSKWAKGFTAQEAERLRMAYRAPDFFAGNDKSAFAYLNISEVVTTMMIPRSGTIAALTSEPIPGIADVVATSEFGAMPLAKILADPRSRAQAFLVMHKGRIVYETYPGMPSDMMHLWASSSKTINGLLIDLLAREGLIDLKAPVSTYLAFTKGKPIGKIAVEDVLHMRSGLDFEESQANRTKPDHPVAWAFAAALSERGAKAGPSLREIVVKVPALVPPNTVFSYSTFNTQILGYIVEEVTKTPWNRVVAERIWKKVGMEGDALLAISPAGEPLSGGIFASRLRDFARYGLLFTPSWTVVAKERIVPEDYLDKVKAAANPDIYLKGEMGQRMKKMFGADDAPLGGAYQWDAVFRDGDLYKSGLLGQGLYVSPETDTVVVWFSTTWQNAHPLTAYARAIVKTLFRRKN